jgi:hypothetical protein
LHITEVRVEKSPSNWLKLFTSVTTKILIWSGILHNSEVKAKMELENIIRKQLEIDQSEVYQNQSLLQRGRAQNLKAITNTQQSIA